MLEGIEKFTNVIESANNASLGFASIKDIVRPNTGSATPDLPVVEIHESTVAKAIDRNHESHNTPAQALQSLATFGLPDAYVGVGQIITYMIGTRDTIAGKIAADWLRKKHVAEYYAKARRSPLQLRMA